MSHDVQGCGVGTASERTRTGITQSLLKKLVDLMNEFQRLRQRLQDEYRCVCCSVPLKPRSQGCHMQASTGYWVRQPAEAAREHNTAAKTHFDQRSTSALLYACLALLNASGLEMLELQASW